MLLQLQHERIPKTVESSSLFVKNRLLRYANVVDRILKLNGQGLILEKALLPPGIDRVLSLEYR